LQGPTVFATLPDSALAHLGLVVDHVGADRQLARLSKLEFMWIQYMRVSYDSVKSERSKAERGLAFDLAEEFDWSSASICTCWCSRRAATRCM